jgi:hypothetical protein
MRKTGTLKHLKPVSKLMAMVEVNYYLILADFEFQFFMIVQKDACFNLM